MGRHSKQNHITLLVDLHLVQGVQIFHTINLRSTDSTVGGARASKYNISIFQYFQGGNDFVNPLSLLRLGSTSFRDILLSAMYISSFLNKRAKRLRFLELFLVVIAIYRLRILLEGR